MIKASFSLSETGSVREENQDSFLLDAAHGIFAVADGLGGLPNGSRASRTTLEIIHRKLLNSKSIGLASLIAEVNERTREIGYQLDESGFGTTLTLGVLHPKKKVLDIAHVGDSSAFLARGREIRPVTVEHTVAARMAAEQWSDVYESIPPSAHHTLTQCIGQDLYIDPQLIELPVQPGDRFYLFTDGVTKALGEDQLRETLLLDQPLERICQAITFRIEIAGSPDNYTIVAVEF